MVSMSSDAKVMEYFPALLTKEQCKESVERYTGFYRRDGFCMMPATLKETGEFIGIIGMQTMRDAVPGLAQPAVEIGWRLTQAAQGKGLATEGAHAIVQHAFDTLRLPRVVAITAVQNVPSRHVMEKLGMQHMPTLDFDHPRVPEGHPYRRHVLYSLSNPAIAERTEE